MSYGVIVVVILVVLIKITSGQEIKLQLIICKVFTSQCKLLL